MPAIMSKKKRIDIDSDSGGLTSNPFAGLAGNLPADLPEGLSETPVPDEKEGRATPSAYSVGKTRKRGYPITLERRAKGKLATVIGNVSGDAALLLKDLKKRCGAGGVVREGTVELQGDHRKALEDILKAMGF
jgi:translation initiation factor 1 (eIF-1/SUI1)